MLLYYNHVRIQVTLTVNEAKRIIAKGIALLPSVQKALVSGKVFLKGGTTVSAACEELTGKPLRISGRITPQGAKTGQIGLKGFHCGLIERGKLQDSDESLEVVVASLNPEDVGILGANAIDAYGNAALFYGAPLWPAWKNHSKPHRGDQGSHRCSRVRETCACFASGHNPINRQKEYGPCGGDGHRPSSSW